MARAVLLPLPSPRVKASPGMTFGLRCDLGFGFVVRDADIALVRQHAAPFIVEALEQDRSVYGFITRGRRASAWLVRCQAGPAMYPEHCARGHRLKPERKNQAGHGPIHTCWRTLVPTP